MFHEFRAAPRYFLLHHLPAVLADIPSSVVDLSPKGARVHLQQPLTVGSTLPFRLSTDAGQLDVTARVLWCELAAMAVDDAASDRYLCGVRFEETPATATAVIASLLTTGAAMLIEDCRRAERYRLRTSLTASFGSHSSVRVRDISLHGIRVHSPEPMETGMVAALRFRIHGRETPVDLRAHVAWSQQGERLGTFECGLQIDEGQEWLRAVIDELSLRNEIELETGTLQRKFDPLAGEEMTGLINLVH
jgi:PilZ domain.